MRLYTVKVCIKNTADDFFMRLYDKKKGLSIYSRSLAFINAEKELLLNGELAYR